MGTSDCSHGWEGFGRAAPCTCSEPEQQQQQQQQRACRGMAGRCGWAGHAVNPSLGARWRHPWRQRSCPPTPPHL
ncbi:hypothetical protein D7Y49_03705 [Stenotrophomonas maltophilia]|nr:hypothetical protein [Stenotrophomonas maltophilia]MBA0333349.1 hypothetical protein [Stenotrophomonas maltophilia]